MRNFGTDSISLAPLATLTSWKRGQHEAQDFRTIPGPFQISASPEAGEAKGFLSGCLEEEGLLS